MKKYNYIVSVVMLLLSGYIFYESSGYTIGSSAQKNPAVWPCILAGALALLSVALIIETALKKEPGEEKKAINWKSPGMIHVYIMWGIVVGCVVKYMSKDIKNFFGAMYHSQERMTGSLMPLVQVQ